jgi:hypothetical protein
VPVRYGGIEAQSAEPLTDGMMANGDSGTDSYLGSLSRQEDGEEGMMEDEDSGEPSD